MPRQNRLWIVWQVLRHFGPRWLVHRAIYRGKLASGYMAMRTRRADWSRLPLGDFLVDPCLADPDVYREHRKTHGGKLFFSTADRAAFAHRLSRWDDQDGNPAAEAEALRSGRFRYFGHETADLGFPPDWHRNPFTGDVFPRDEHWSRIPDFDHGDVKTVWEPSRFAFAFALVRAYWRTGNEDYAEAFWRLVESWRDQNPPNHGPNWKCGQEAALRVTAWCFGLYGFADCRATTPDRVAELARMIAVAGRRIEANIGYALSQMNNHPISEAMGLWTIGLLFPEFRDASRWRRRGREILESSARTLIYDDGAFSQHSFNYQRLMLHDYIWSARLGQLNGRPLSNELMRRIGRAGDLLFAVQDEETGQVPCYGANDGALVLPLSNCRYQDFRPVVGATKLLTAASRCYPDGPWDEDLLWLFGPGYESAPVESPRRNDLAAEQGGYYTLRSSHGFVFTRCARLRHRPGDADMLHVDLWWRGRNIAVDPGTYSYNAPAPWSHALSGAACHNTVTVAGRDPMERVSRFMWLPWVHGEHLPAQRSPGGRLGYWQGRHNGYRRLRAPVAYRRGVLRLDADGWLILDRLESRRENDYHLHWLLMDAPYDWDERGGSVLLHTPAGDYRVRCGLLSGRGRCSLARADAESPRGWRSLYYGSKEPALSLELTTRARCATFWTLFAPGVSRIAHDGDKLVVESETVAASVRISADSDTWLIRSAELTGTEKDRLTIG